MKHFRISSRAIDVPCGTSTNAWAIFRGLATGRRLQGMPLRRGIAHQHFENFRHRDDCRDPPGLDLAGQSLAGWFLGDKKPPQPGSAAESAGPAIVRTGDWSGRRFRIRSGWNGPAYFRYLAISSLATGSRFARRLRCVITTPLGSAVVPDVNTIFRDVVHFQVHWRYRRRVGSLLDLRHPPCRDRDFRARGRVRQSG